MNALADEKKISKTLFISPIVNMEKLICNMMTWANVTEEQLKSKCEIRQTSAKRSHGNISAM